jgi:hypothetical protein
LTRCEQLDDFERGVGELSLETTSTTAWLSDVRHLHGPPI